VLNQLGDISLLGRDRIPNIKTITSKSTAQPTYNVFIWASVIDLAQKLLVAFHHYRICIFIIMALLSPKKEVVNKAQPMNGFSKNEIKVFVSPLLFLCNTRGVSDIAESPSYRNVVKYMS